MKIKLKRGLSSNITSVNLDSGEPAFCTDTGKLYVGDGTQNILINPDDGIATEAGKLSVARKISLSGDASGNVSFDGSADVTLSVTVADDSHNHIISNIDGLQDALDAKETPAGAQTKVDAHANLTNNPHSVTKSQVGLGSVSNYGLATQAEAEAGTSGSKYMTPLRTKQAINVLQAVKSVAGKTGTVTLTKGDVGLSNVDNTSDMDKPISTAVQTALDGKVDNSRVLTDVPVNAEFTDTITTINGKTGAITKADIVALGIPAQDTNTTYSEISTSEIDAGTSSTLRTITGRRVKYVLDKIQGWLNNKVDKIEGKGLSTEDYTSAEKTKLSGIEAGAEVNQNAFSNIKVGTTTIAADSKTDTLELTAGTGITLTPDATNDKVTVSVASAPKLTTARTISLSGDVSGSTSFNGSANVTITATVADDSHNHVISNIDGLQSALDSKQASLGFTPLNANLKGAVNGVAELDATGKVPASQLPSYVDDVLEYDNQAGFPSTGETGKIYVAKNTNKTYRWSGSGYVEISASIALGTTSSTAFRGDYGQTAYTHSQSAHAPANAQKNSDITKAEIEAKLTGTITTHSHTVTKADVGLGNVTNESKATMFASPTFTGTPKTPTAAKGTNTTQIASTAYVMTALGDYVKITDDIDGGTF